jgi:rod shape-determining protein MreC
MKNLKKKFRFRIHLKSKHLLAIMTFFCVSAIVATLASGVTSAPLQEAAGLIIVPFEKSIASIGQWMTGVQDSFQEKEDLIQKNKELQTTVDTLTEQNNVLLQDQAELARLEQLYELDEEYTDYPKVAARIISKDPGNWYDTFMINRGSNDGIRVDNNVIAGKGLVGIVTEVGSNWATVRSIIDDSSNVSAMTVSTDDICVVEGDLELIDEGKLRFSQLYDREDKVSVGERIVTSNISDKYVEGLFIGYVSEIELDTNNLTKTGTLVTPVDFQHLKDVFVITTNKQDAVQEKAEEKKAMQPQKRTLQRRQNNEKQTCSVFYHYCVFSFTVHSPSLCLDWLYHTEPSSDPVYFHGTDARTEKRNVDRIFLRYSDRSVFWLCSWILCADLHVCGIYQRIYLSYLL